MKFVNFLTFARSLVAIVRGTLIAPMLSIVDYVSVPFPRLVRSIQEFEMLRAHGEKSTKSNRLKSFLKALTRAAVLTTTLLFSSPSTQAAVTSVTPKKSIRERVELVRQTLKQKVADDKTAGSQLSFSESSLTQQWGNWGNWNNWLNWNNWNNWRNWGNWGNWGNV